MFDYKQRETTPEYRENWERIYGFHEVCVNCGKLIVWHDGKGYTHQSSGHFACAPDSAEHATPTERLNAICQ